MIRFHGDPLNFHEVSEPAKSQRANRLAVNLRDHMGRRGEVIAVEFLVERTSLLAHVDKAAKRKHAHQCIEIACDADADAVRGRSAVEKTPLWCDRDRCHEASSSLVSENGGEKKSPGSLSGK